LNKLGGEHGVGRVDLVENRFVGMKSRGVYETPGVTVLQAAHRAVESLTMDREVMRLRDQLSLKFAELAYYGFWFTPEMRVLRKTIEETQLNVTGEARVRLFKGSVQVLGRRAPKSLYSPKIASFEDEKAGRGITYNQKDAEGFIRLQALRLRVAAEKGVL
jgi:argininosuccinate synthase